MNKTILATTDRSSIERMCRQLACSAVMPGGDTLCRVLGSYPFVVTLDDFEVAPHLVMDGFWETWVSMCLARRVKKGWSCIDVGANFGYYTVLLADLVGVKEGTGYVEAWEPSQDLLRRLRKTLELNGLDARVDLVECAASSQRGTVRLERQPNRYGSAKVRPADGGQVLEHSGALVTSLRLDEKWPKDQPVDFVKIDAEGHEPEIWQGMTEVLARGWPKAMLMEWSPSLYSDPGSFGAMILGSGFSIGVVNGEGNVTPTTVADLLAVKGHADLWLERGLK